MLRMLPIGAGPVVARCKLGIFCTTAILAASAIAGVSGAAIADGTQAGPVVTLTRPSGQAAEAIDYANARPMPLPKSPIAPPSQLESLSSAPAVNLGTPAFFPGRVGTGEQTPVVVVPAKFLLDRQSAPSDVTPQEFGTSGQPFTTNRVNASGDTTSAFYPFRAAGKLFFKVGAASAVCSASLIKPGIVVTAAHCVANFGAKSFYTGWQFMPAYNNGTAPFGISTWASATILTVYYNGTDACAVRGIVCQDDVAVITLKPSGGSYVGRRTGWYGYGVNGYGYNTSKQGLINQLGYPGCTGCSPGLDSGLLMERTDFARYRDRFAFQQHGHRLATDGRVKRRSLAGELGHCPGADRHQLRLGGGP